MSTSFKQCGVALAAAFACLAVPAQAVPIVNGGFEAGLANWIVVDQPGSEGTFTVQSGTTSPVTNMDVPAPPEGTNAALTDAEGGGSHVLYQDFLQTSAVGSALLSFDLFIGNRANAFFVPGTPTLDWATTALNQQARVDILLAGSDPFSMAAGDLLLNLFATAPGDPLVSGYNHVEIDITGLLNANLNTALRLRFSEVDNVNVFQFGVDNVVLVTQEVGDVPEPGTWMLVLAGLGAAAFVRRTALRV